MKELTQEALEARREYKRRWYAANKEKVKAYNAAYWERKAKERKSEDEEKAHD